MGFLTTADVRRRFTCAVRLCQRSEEGHGCLLLDLVVVDVPEPQEREHHVAQALVLHIPWRSHGPRFNQPNFTSVARRHNPFTQDGGTAYREEVPLQECVAGLTQTPHVLVHARQAQHSPARRILVAHRSPQAVLELRKGVPCRVQPLTDPFPHGVIPQEVQSPLQLVLLLSKRMDLPLRQ